MQMIHVMSSAYRYFIFNSFLNVLTFSQLLTIITRLTNVDTGKSFTLLWFWEPINVNRSHFLSVSMETVEEDDGVERS